MVHVNKNDKAWLSKILMGLEYEGYALLTGALNKDFLEKTRAAMYDVQEKIRKDVTQKRLNNAGELGVARLMMKYNSHFFSLLELPFVLEIVDAVLSPTALLHQQNGFILPPTPHDNTPKIAQNQFHRDVWRVLNGYMASVNIFFIIDEFTEENGATRLVPGTHQKEIVPSPEYLEENAISAVCPAGSIFVFDSTLWHCAGKNHSTKDRLAINHQFTHSYFKQQIDFSRALGSDILAALPPRTKQLLGWHTRVPSSLDEYYQPPEKRLYRSNQG